jgi:hypothetical protein
LKKIQKTFKKKFPQKNEKKNPKKKKGIFKTETVKKGKLRAHQKKIKAKKTPNKKTK